MIRLVGEDAPADLAIGGGEEDLRRLEMESGVLIRLQRIYNFLLFHDIILSTLDVLYAFICYFI